MFTGRDALLSLEQAIGRARADEKALDTALRSAIDEVARLRHEEAEGFRALATVKLDALAREKMTADLDALEKRALAMVERHRETLERLSREREEASGQLEAAEADKHARDDALAATIEALDHLRAEVSERMSRDAAWREAKAAAEAADSVAIGAAEKAKLAEADSAEKRAPYESDPLFVYLWSRKHGTFEDRTGNFVRFLDRLIARLVRYPEARANYAMLREIPLRLTEHAKAKAEEAKGARERLARIERAALDAAGAKVFEAKVAAATEAVRAAEAKVDELTAALQKIDAEREKVLGAGEDAGLGGAIELLAQGLAREDMRALYDEAYQTPTPADERALDAITKARGKLAAAEAEVARIRADVREMAKRRSELEGARDRARHGGYDSPLGTLASQALLAEVIGAVLRGAMRGSDLDRVFRDNFQRRGPRSDPDFGGANNFPWGGGPWGGGGSSGGGGWRTGGSF